MICGVILVGAIGADARARNRGRSEDETLVVAEALDGGDGGARQGEPPLLVGVGGGESEIAGGAWGIPDVRRFFEALVGPGLGLDEVELKNAGSAAAAAMWVVVLLVLALAGLFTPPSGHVLD